MQCLYWEKDTFYFTFKKDKDQKLEDPNLHPPEEEKIEHQEPYEEIKVSKPCYKPQEKPKEEPLEAPSLSFFRELELKEQEEHKRLEPIH